MYNTTEFFMDDGFDLKEVLKSSIYNYYINNKVDKDSLKELKNKKINRIMEQTNELILSQRKETVNEY